MNDNPYFTSHAESYAEDILSIQPEFYQNAGCLLNAYLPEGGRVLDIGNGGVINYDHSRLAHLDCADLVVSQTAVQKYAVCPNIHFLQGDVLNLPKMLSAPYDAVIMQAVIHHLAGATYKESLSRVNAAVAECLRILRPGGLLLVAESTVVPWFEAIERSMYPLMQAFFAICRFGHVYQFSPQSLARLLSDQDHAELFHTEAVEIGRTIWIMGKSVPTKLTPCGATLRCFPEHRPHSGPVFVPVRCHLVYPAAPGGPLCLSSKSPVFLGLRPCYGFPVHSRLSFQH